MQESGIPVTYGYISDLHERKAGTSGCTTAPATGSGKPIGPGDSCYVSNAKAYDAAFATFFQRLAADGITPANTEFVISSEENDQFAGANVGRATQPTPAGCDGVTVPATTPPTQIGELQANIKGLLSTTASSGTAFDIEPQGASIYVHGQPAATDPTVRQLQRDTAAMTGNDPYTGVTDEKITNYQAGAIEQRILHMQTSDPLRTPTYTLFPKPDYYFSTSGPNVSINNGFAYNHGYYSPNIDVTWSSLVGPGVAVRGRRRPAAGGRQPAVGPELDAHRAAGQHGRHLGRGDRPAAHPAAPDRSHRRLPDRRPGDQPGARPTRPGPCADTEALAAAYQQLNSSVGEFATNTLIADSAALASGSASDDSAFTREQRALLVLADARDRVAASMKTVLIAAAAGHAPNHGQVTLLQAQARVLIWASERLAGGTGS